MSSEIIEGLKERLTISEDTRIMFKRLLRNPTAAAGLFIVVMMAFIAIAAPLIAPYDPNKVDTKNRLQPPSREHIFGTDQLGRDLFSRVIYGSRISLTIAMLAVAITALIGVPIGLVSGYYGGKVDEVLMRITDMFMAFPRLVLALAFAAALGPSLYNTIIAISLAYWTIYARLVRGIALQTKNEAFIEAAIAAGASTPRIIFKHVFPMVTAPLLVQATLDFGATILLAAGLGFLGLGAQPPTPEWGVMVSEGRQFLVTGEWWISFFPGLFILLTALGFNLLGDSLRDITDVRARR
ncbi:MAG: ABC transporter permease [Desulfurococcales archaeon]|nr:ABC transporter permease [Desulfurococcales archaeon]